MEDIKGKNKDGFFRDGKIVFRFSDRLSVFDRVIGEIPGRGRILAECTRIIFTYLSRNNITTALVEDETNENTLVQEKCRPLDFEFIMRNLLSGSALKRVKTGEILLPAGMVVKNYSRFPETYVEVSTKRETKDRYGLTSAEIKEIMINGFPELNQEEAFGLYTQALNITKRLSSLLSPLFKRANLYMIDGKVEFGVDAVGRLCLIDSFGPDEFRAVELTWAQGPRNTTPKFFDKEFLRQKLQQVDESKYEKILRKYGPTLISLFREVTERLKEASER